MDTEAILTALSSCPRLKDVALVLHLASWWTHKVDRGCRQPRGPRAVATERTGRKPLNCRSLTSLWSSKAMCE